MASDERVAAERRSREERLAAEREARRREAAEVLAEGVRAMRALLMHERSAADVYRGLVEKHGDDKVDLWVSFDRNRALEGEVAMATARVGLNVPEELRRDAWAVMGCFAALRAPDYDPSRRYSPPRHPLTRLESFVEHFEEQAAAEIRRLAEEHPEGSVP